ncbi:MAG: MBL fold metallo-hydrolase [Polyangiaceae bacterium]|nr:MBL fold metallo-hydrolase [Polyangiaceae bacterium]
MLFGPDALGVARDRRSVAVRWLGTAGFAIEHDGHVLLVDPYLTRAPLARCALGTLTPDLALLRREVPRADAIVVGHTHFDHVLDVPALARQTGAPVFGSRSLAALCRAAGLPEGQIHLVEPGALAVERAVGPFLLRFFAGAHSPLLLGRVPFPGDIADCSDVPAHAWQYRCGAVLRIEVEVAGKRIVHLGSAELVTGAAPARRDADLLLLCVAGWTTSERLPERVLRAVSPAAILLCHWDDFFRPLERPARALPAMRLPALVERLDRASRAPRLGTLAFHGEVWL